MNTRLNALDLALDIAGSLTHLQNLSLSDEAAGLGVPLAGLSGSAAAVASVAGNFATITGLTGMTAGMIGNWITFSNSINPASNNGTFLIDGYVDGGSVIVVNYNPAVVEIADMDYVCRGPYTAENDINYARTDRAAIKGVNYYDAIPTYTRPTATGTPRPTNLANIAGKTTDARGFIVNRVFYRQDVAASDTLITLSDLTNLKHSDAGNKDGVPCFDVAAPYLNNYAACFVELTDGYTDDELFVKSGIHASEKIYGLTYAGSSLSPDSVEVRFFSVPHGSDISTSSSAYTWEATQTTSINTTYGFFQRLDEMPEETFRTIYSNGISSDAALAQTIDNILETIGSTSTTTSLAALLTNTDGYYAFFNLLTATPSVVDAVNVLNEQIGNRVFTGTTLTSGETITQSLQQLSNAIGTSTINRIIERLPGDVNPGDEHFIPGLVPYTMDGDSGRYLFLYTRGILRDPGTVSDGNDYVETSTTSITFHAKQRAGDHINYFIKG